MGHGCNICIVKKKPYTRLLMMLIRHGSLL